MQVVAKCPKCDAGLPVGAADAPAAVTCGGCGGNVPLDLSDAVRRDIAVDRCPVCSGGDFYIRKDFDPKLGLTVVIIGAAISAVFYWFKMDLVAYGVLGGAALLDLAMYGRLKVLTVCYRCHTEFRGDYPRTAVGFDLHTADVLEQEYERRIGRR
jgi:hypothetical protein